VPEEALPPLPPPSASSLLLPPAPIIREDNWPLLTVSKGFFEMLAAKGAAAAAKGKPGVPGAAAAPAVGAVAAAAAAAAGIGLGGLDDADLEGAGWGDDEDDVMGGGGGGEDGEGGEGGEEGDEGWDMEDLDLPADLAADAGAAGAGASGGDDEGPYVAPAPGVPASQRWLERRGALAAEHCAAGQFASAMQLLFRQLGAVEFGALRGHMLELYYASHGGLPGLPVGCAGFGCLVGLFEAAGVMV
jgi:coatomer protein complex subunit alpha (xenin)